MPRSRSQQAVEPHTKALRMGALRAGIRRFFDSRSFLEIDSPLSYQDTLPERGVDVVSFKTSMGDSRVIRPSPEQALKRLLSTEIPLLFELATVVRDDAQSPHHHPEFRLLEWYRLGGSYKDAIEDSHALVRALEQELSEVGLRDPHLPFVADTPAVLSVEEAFAEHAGFSLLSCLELDALRAEATALGTLPSPEDDWSDLFHRIFLNKVEPALLRSMPPFFVLKDYPAELGALARLSPEDPRVALRFEVYYHGRELANGYDELCDPIEQLGRFERERSRAEGPGGAFPTQNIRRFVDALPALGAACGVALGIERLCMGVFGLDDIRDTMPLTWRTI